MDWLNQLDAQWAEVSLWGGEFSGRLRGVRSPAVVLSAPCPNEAAALSATARWLGRINGRSPGGWHIQPAGSVIDGVSLYGIECTGVDAYRDLEPGERFGLAFRQGRVHVGTSRAVLERLLEGEAAPSTFGAVLGPPFVAGSVGGIRVDLAAGGKTLRNGLAVVTLYDLMSGGPTRHDPAKRMKVLSRLLSSLESLDSASLAARPDGEETVIEMRIGP
jgi:hypothetical protein